MVVFSVVLLQPKYEGNIGFVARAMKNFGLRHLYLIDGEAPMGSEAYARASHASEILDNAKPLDFDDLFEKFDLVVGTTGISKKSPTSPRAALSPTEFSKRIKRMKGKGALVFGREDIGMKNEELERCDLVVSIPTSEEYPILNISHAASIIFYELFKDKVKEDNFMTEEAIGEEKEAMISRFSELLDALGYPKFKKKVIVRMFRRLMGRAPITGREAHTLAGVFRESKREIERQ